MMAEKVVPTRDSFGRLQDGTEISRFTFKNKNNVTVRIINYGGIITDILVPDKNGKVVDINLGFDDIKGYEARHPYFGAICGRVANRIASGKFSLDGKEYQLPVNNDPNHLHGGVKGFDKAVWAARVDGDTLVLKYVSPDGEEQYPGELITEVRYRLTSKNELSIDYTATTTKATPINLTNHAYLNLAGQGYPNLEDHVLWIDAFTYTPLDENNIPTGIIAPVAGTAYDLRTPTRLGDRLKNVNNGKGYDTNFCVGGQLGKLTRVASLEHPPSGRKMDVFTTEPGLQCYTGCNMKPEVFGKGGVEYRKLASVCLETQHYADSVNQSNFPSTILRPGQTYRHTTVYKFGLVS